MAKRNLFDASFKKWVKANERDSIEIISITFDAAQSQRRAWQCVAQRAGAEFHDKPAKVFFGATMNQCLERVKF